VDIIDRAAFGREVFMATVHRRSTNLVA
jgi:hypothetical protein